MIHDDQVLQVGIGPQRQAHQVVRLDQLRHVAGADVEWHQHEVAFTHGLHDAVLVTGRRVDEHEVEGVALADIPQERIEGRADILLAASLATDGPNDMSWGLFRGFRIASRGGNAALLQ